MNKNVIIALLIISVIIGGCSSGSDEEQLTPEEYVMGLDMYSELDGRNLKVVEETEGLCDTCVDYKYVFDPAEDTGLDGEVMVIVSVENDQVVKHELFDDTFVAYDETMQNPFDEAYDEVYSYAMASDQYLQDNGRNLRFLQYDTLDCENCYEFYFLYDAADESASDEEPVFEEKELYYTYKDGIVEE